MSAWTTQKEVQQMNHKGLYTTLHKYHCNTPSSVMAIPLGYTVDTFLLIPRGLKYKPKNGYPLGYHCDTFF